MPQLNILHHKSYHPYLEKNKQRVREDEARAAAEELAREQARIDASSASRLDELRRRAGSPSFNRPDDEADNLPSTSSSRQGGTADNLIDRHRKEKARQEKREKKQKERLDFEWPAETARREARRAERRREEGYDERRHDRDVLSRGEAGDADASAVWMENGHINLFADVEKEQSKAPPTMADIAKKKKEQEADQYTVYLSRPDKETKPWYSDRNLKRYEELEMGEDAEARRERDRRKDARSKNRHDPLIQISTLLPKHGPHPSRKPAAASSLPARSAAETRLSRETSERARALALIAKTKADRERAKSGGSNRWDDTPMSAGHGGHSWADDFERDKERAGMRFYSDDRRAKIETRRWDR